MMLTIHGLPPKTTFKTLKALIKQECNIVDFILDSLMDDGPKAKKVKIGVSDDSEGYRLMKVLDGFRMSAAHILKIVPVGKPINPQGFEQNNQRFGYQNEPQNEFMNTNQPQLGFNQPNNDFNIGPQGDMRQSGGNMNSYGGPNQQPDFSNSGIRPNLLPVGQGPNMGMQGPQGPDRQWGPNTNAPGNQWIPPAQNQGNFQRPQGGFGPQNDMRTNLHSVQVSNQLPYADKPGPSQYNMPGQPDNAPYHAQGSIPVWNQQGQPKQFDDRGPHPDKGRDFKPSQEYDKPGNFSQPNTRPMSPGRRFDSGKGYPNSGRPFDNSGRPLDNSGRPVDNSGRPFDNSGRPFDNSGRPFESSGRHSPTGRHGMPVREFSPSGRRISPAGRRISPRRMSPSGRKFSPTGRKFSPPGRKFSPPSRKFSPPGRKFSPPGRKFSPPGRKFSPPGRRMSPSDRRDGPRLSPSDARRLSRRDSPKRASPTRRLVSPPHSNRYREGHLEKHDDKMMKPIRPAYEPSQAQNQGYSGAYRGNDRDSAHYSGREPWQSDKTYAMQKEDLRNEIIRRSEATEKSRGRSRSPVRRERSPLKDRYRRISPSSRSPLSPRRSWALEKRVSPPAPPPPMWPGHDSEGPPKRVSRFDVPPTHTPVWERPERTEDDRRRIEEKLRVRTDLGDKITQQAPNRRDYEERREFRSEHDTKKFDIARERKQLEDRRDFRPEPDTKKYDIDRDYQRKEDLVESARRENSVRSDKTVLAEIDKDFHDIYKRAVEFRKKTEELRKSGDRRRDDYDAGRPGDKKYRRESPPRQRSRERHEPNKTDELPTRQRAALSKAAKLKRERAVDEISERILKKYDIKSQHRTRISEELKLTLSSIFIEMFQDNDVSFIELVVKYRARYDAKAEEKLLQKVLDQLPSKYRDIKRKSEEDSSDNAVKALRVSPPQDTRKEMPRPKLADAVVPGWNTGLEPPKVLEMPLVGLGAMGSVMSMQPMMVPSPGMFAAPQNIPQQPVFQAPQTNLSHQPVFQPPPQPNMSQAVFQSALPPSFEPPAEECFNLYLCQDDFEAFSDVQADYLKNFLISQMIKVSESGQGWAPDFTLKGLQGMYRYEVSTTDEASKNWLVNLDFAEFEYFNVLVYTKEELWYERAAIWLPGHSRVRNIEPLDKLRMQNRHLTAVHLDRWKFVKKIVTVKGTRLYVDMPPSSARALEDHKMLLSYELQKVTVFLKAVAVDKDSFDAGLKEVSITDKAVLTDAVKNAVMPTLNANNEPGLVKLGLNGSKSVTVHQARKIKDVLIYNLFKYYEQNGTSKTDFVKHGYCTPGFFAVMPENNESKRWLYSRQFGKINRQPIVVLGSDDDNTKYFKMLAYIPHEYKASAHLAFERLKQSNQGVKGINFNLWKPVNIKIERKRAVLEVEVDLESVEVIIKMKYKLDYVGEYGIQSVDFKSEYALSKLEEKVKTYKMEQVDSYDVAKMDLDSEESDDDILCLG